MDIEAWRCDWAGPAGLMSAFYDRNRRSTHGSELLSPQRENGEPHPLIQTAVCGEQDHEPPVDWCTCGVYAVRDLADIVPLAEALDRCMTSQPHGHTFPALTKVRLEGAIPDHLEDPVNVIRVGHGAWGVTGDPASTHRGRRLIITGPILTTSPALVMPLARQYRVKVGHISGSLADAIRSVTGATS